MSNPLYDTIRPDIIESIQRYVDRGIPTGGFLEALLSNDLKETCARADDDNRHTIFHIVAYCYNEIPSGCWGSPKKVEKWLNDWAERRAQENHDG